MVRDPDWQAAMRAKPLKQRLALANEARRQSMEQTINMSLEIMDVNQDAVKDALRRHNVSLMIHGHTHRPAIHDLEIDSGPARRIVLGDWYKAGHLLRVTGDQFELEEFS